MAVPRRRRALPKILFLLAATFSFYSCQLFVGAPVAARPKPLAWGSDLRRRIVRQGEGDVSSPRRSAALVKVEEDIEAKIVEAEEAKDKVRVTQLARLLVMTKASEGAAAWQATQELADAVGESMAETLTEFVGKDDYDIKDVATEVDLRIGDAVKNLDNVYLTAEAAKSAPPGSNPVLLSEITAPLVDQCKEAAKESVLAFTGKEEYKFGDITKEAAARSSKAIASILGKEEYQFGDISKAAAAKAMEAVTSFTGKKDYKFGDVTKTLLRGALDFLEGDDKKKE